MEGWVTLHRKFLQWEWFDIPEMVKLFIYLLLMAQHSERKHRGITLQRGELVTSIPTIMKDCKLSEQQARTCIKRLKSTGEITCKSTNKYTIITICNYDRYQNDNLESNGQNNGQTNTQATDKQRTNNGHNNNNNVIIKQLNNNSNNSNNNSACVCEERDKIFEIFFFKNFIAPEIEVQRFYDHYEASGWCRASGIEIEDRLALARLWKQKEAKQRFPQVFLEALQEVCMELDNAKSLEMLRGIDMLDREEGCVRACCSSRNSAETLVQYIPLLVAHMGCEVKIALKRTN
jgi:hypothetical protein